MGTDLIAQYVDDTALEAWKVDAGMSVEFKFQPERWKLAAGGLTMFVNALTGAAVEALDVIILQSRVQRVLWDQTEQVKMPLCKSADGLTGDPSADDMTPSFLRQATALPKCSVCPLNQFGTGKLNARTGKRGRACAEKRALVALYAVPDGSLYAPLDELPALLNVPTMSVKALDNYLSGLVLGRVQVNNKPLRNLPGFAVATRLTVTASGEGNQKFGVMNFQVLGLVNPAHRGVIGDLRSRYAHLLNVVDNLPDEIDASIATPPEAPPEDTPF